MFSFPLISLKRIPRAREQIQKSRVSIRKQSCNGVYAFLLFFDFSYVELDEYMVLLRLIVYQLHKDYVTKETHAILIVRYLRRNSVQIMRIKNTLPLVD